MIYFCDVYNCNEISFSIYITFYLVPYPGIPPPVHCTKKGGKKRRGVYVNWFTEDKWPLIEAAVKKHQSLSAALHYLKLTHMNVI